jgi:hypothetical protein
MQKNLTTTIFSMFNNIQQTQTDNNNTSKMKTQQFAQQMTAAFEAALREDADNLCLVNTDITRVMKLLTSTCESLLGQGKSTRTRGQSPYQYWKSLNKAKVAEDNPTSNYKEISAIMKAQWAAMNEAEKAPFVESAQALREALPSSPKSEQAEDATQEDTGEKPKSTRKPRKKGPSAYQAYKRKMKDTFQKQHPDDDYSALSKKMKAAWDALDEAEQASYKPTTQDSTHADDPQSVQEEESQQVESVEEESGQEESVEESEEESEQESEQEESGVENLPPLLKAKQVGGISVQKLFEAAQSKKKDTDKPETKPAKAGRKPRIKGRSAYQAFKAEMKDTFTQQNPDDDYSALSKKMKAAWDALDEEGRAPYKLKSEEVRAGLTPPSSPLSV